jgi:hypothetical protein
VKYLPRDGNYRRSEIKASSLVTTIAPKLKILLVQLQIATRSCYWWKVARNATINCVVLVTYHFSLNIHWPFNTFIMIDLPCHIKVTHKKIAWTIGEAWTLTIIHTIMFLLKIFHVPHNCKKNCNKGTKVNRSKWKFINP